LPKENNIMATWEGRVYEIALQTLGDEAAAQQSFRFRFVPVPSDGTETWFFRVEPENEGDPNPLAAYGFIPQSGRTLTKYIHPDDRLDPESDNYQGDLQDLMDEIVGDKLAEDPCSYERLVGFIPHLDEPLNPVTIYQVENTHVDTAVLLLVRARVTDGNPDGGIIIVGRT
jgi:hypothetical protein